MSYKELFTTEQHNEGSEMQLTNQYGKKTDMYITVAGIDSAAWRYEKVELERKTLAKRADLIRECDKVDTKILTTAVDELTAEALANITIGWRGFLDESGKKIKFSNKKIKELYLCAPYIKDQVDIFFTNRVNFTKGKAA